MINFKILKKSQRSRARLGILKTPHGEIETPAFVPVATQAAIKGLFTPQAIEAGSQLFICNTFHLHLKPGERFIKSAGGLHKFMGIKKPPLMTDSGGFQVFSLGFGHDLDLGKLNKFFPGKKVATVEKGKQPKTVKITDDGVFFRSPVDGKKLFIGPKESIKIQGALGADIIFAFDECTPPFVTEAYMKTSLDRTNRWAKICLESKKTDQAIYGIVQGSVYKQFRQESSQYINSLGFDGFGIGGDLGLNKKQMFEILSWVIPNLNEKKPRHLLGIGSLEDIENIVRSGIDTFDCIIPTHYARHGTAFISGPDRAGHKRLDLKKSSFLKDKKPLDQKCRCFVCQTYTRSYICHLFKAKEITGPTLLTFHNLFYFNNFVKEVRKKIAQGMI